MGWEPFAKTQPSWRETMHLLPYARGRIAVPALRGREFTEPGKTGFQFSYLQKVKRPGFVSPRASP
jgi:hypothetical protein